MNQIILGLMLFCSPLEAKSEAGFTVQHNCNQVNYQFLDEAIAHVQEQEQPWVKDVLPWTTRIVVATYYVPRDCNRTILWAVVPGANGSEVIVLHPDIFKNLDASAIAQALDYRIKVLKWEAESNAGVLHGCLN
jgi:hypothetical protein